MIDAIETGKAKGYVENMRKENFEVRGQTPSWEDEMERDRLAEGGRVKKTVQK